MKLVKYIVIILFLISCKGKTNYEKPEDLIPKDQMIDLLTDIHLASGASSVNNKYSEKSNKYMFLVFDKYKIDSTRFASSNLYYTSNVDEYKKIYDEVEKKLNNIRKEYDVEPDSIDKRIYDSLKNLRIPGKKRKELPK